MKSAKSAKSAKSVKSAKYAKPRKNILRTAVKATTGILAITATISVAERILRDETVAKSGIRNFIRREQLAKAYQAYLKKPLQSNYIFLKEKIRYFTSRK